MRPMRNGIHTVWAAQTVAMAVGLLVGVVATVELSPGERGLLALMLQTGTFAGLLIQRGFAQPLLSEPNFAGENGKKVAFYLVSRNYPSFALVLFFGTMCAISGYIEVALYLVILAIHLVHVAVYDSTRAVSLAGIDRAHFYYTVAYLIGMMLCVIGLVVMDFSHPLSWYAAYLWVSIPAAIIIGLGFFRNRPQNLTDSDRSLIRRVSRRGFRLLPGLLANWFILHLEKIVIPLGLGLKQMGIYSSVSGFFDVFLWPLQVWLDGSLRGWAASYKKGIRPNKLPILVVLGTFALATAGTSVAVWFVVDNLFGSSYQEAKALIPLLALSTLFYGIFRASIALLVAGSNDKMASSLEVFVLVLMLLTLGVTVLSGDLTMLVWGRGFVFIFAAAVGLFFAKTRA